jgi:peptidoglycan hydrolase-like protein with peptidoglycan-binding domain
MKPQVIVLAAIISGLSGAAVAGGPFTSIHPEEAYPDNLAPLTAGDAYEDLLKQVQEKLRANGFAAGPANGTYNSKTQAALAQFQLSRNLPVSGALDDLTLWELGVELPARGTPAETAAEDTPAKVAAEDAERPPQ